MDQPSRSAGIQVLRAVAATLVLLQHIGSYEMHTPGSGFVWYFAYFGFGGVNLFFVISGFIMYEITRSRWGDAHYWRVYAIKRLWRIYPMLWTVMALAFVSMHFAGLSAFCGDATWRGFIDNVFLLSAGSRNCLVPQAWTLNWEVLFYALFGLVLLVPPAISRLLFWIWVALCTAAVAAPHAAGPVYHAAGVYNLHFAIGIVTAIAARKFCGLGWLCIIVGVAWFAAVGVSNAYDFFGPDYLAYRLVEFGVPSALLVYGVIDVERRGVRFPRALVDLGDDSYALYLTHFLVLWWVRPYLTNPASLVENFAATTAGILGALILARAFRLTVERGSQGMLARWLKSQPPHKRR